MPCAHGKKEGVNPARAGMILQEAVLRAADAGKPRASGDDPITAPYRIVGGG